MTTAREHIDSTTVATEYWHRLPDARVQCDACPRYCKLRTGQRGLCFVRQNLGSRIVLTSYGRSSGFCVDPIEKKPLNHFLPGTPVLSFGTAGCNMACKFCQNWDMSKARDMDRLLDHAEPTALAAAAKHFGARAIAYTYNDPTIFLEYAADTAIAARAHGIRSVAVTAGYITPQPRRELFAHMDAANIDLKSFSEDFYRRICGAQLAPVLETLEYVKHRTNCWLEITTLLIPGHNDTVDELKAMSHWVQEHLGPDVPWHFSAFHPDWKMPNVPSTPAQTLRLARRIAREVGMRYVYTGNVHDPEGESTYCHGCGRRLIGRDWYKITAWTLTADSCCPDCGTALPGVFEPRPGDWGARRLPVRLAA